MMDTDELWVLEWSQPQKVFHISTLRESIETNIKAFWDNTKLDWVLIAILYTHEDACEMAKQFEMLECRGARALFQP